MTRPGEPAFYEVRYLITEETALRLRDFTQCYFDFDEYSVGVPNFSYPVHRLYLDSDSLRLYWDAIEDPEHRRHLRIRFHGGGPDDPVYVQHKHWNGDTVTTETFDMHRSGLERLLSGQWLTDRDLVRKTKGHPQAVSQHSVELLNTFCAKPKLHLAFLQEGYVDDCGTCRINFRREVVCEPELAGDTHTHLRNPRRILAPGYVLVALKFRDRYPDWFEEMVRSFSLAEYEFDDYLGAVAAVGAKAIHTPFPVQPRER
jgi:hypothetical protein